jgi:hypothetical protein
MHYADGTPAKHGDLVVHVDPNSSTETAGIVNELSASSDTCNGKFTPVASRQKGTEVWFQVTGQQGWYITLKNCHKLTLPI